MNTSPTAAIRSAPECTFVHVNKLPGKPETARQAASRAARAGELVPVRRGLYYRGRRTRYGMTPPRIDEIVREVLGSRGVGPTGYSAARAWGVTTQVPARYQVATLHPSGPIENVKQVRRSNLARIDLNELEIALLELLRDPDTYVEVGWSNLVERVRQASGAGEVRLAEVGAAVPGERHVSVRTNFQRLSTDLA